MDELDSAAADTPQTHLRDPFCRTHHNESWTVLKADCDGCQLEAERAKVESLQAELAALREQLAEARGAQNGNGYAAVVENERANKLVAELDEMRRQRDEFKALASVGVWHKDCRPNRHKAADEILKSQQRIDALADQLIELRAERDALAARLAAVPELLAEQRHIGHGEGQEHAIADVNAGEIDDLIALRLDCERAAYKSLKAKFEALTHALRALPRYTEYHVRRRPSTDEYVSVDQLEAAILSVDVHSKPTCAKCGADISSFHPACFPTLREK